MTLKCIFLTLKIQVLHPKHNTEDIKDSNMVLEQVKNRWNELWLVLWPACFRDLTLPIREIPVATFRNRTANLIP